MRLKKPMPDCPFCGGYPVLAGDSYEARVMCSECHASGPSVYLEGDGCDAAAVEKCEAEAISAWSRRVK